MVKEYMFLVFIAIIVFFLVYHVQPLETRLYTENVSKKMDASQPFIAYFATDVRSMAMRFLHDILRTFDKNW